MCYMLVQRQRAALKMHNYVQQVLFHYNKLHVPLITVKQHIRSVKFSQLIENDILSHFNFDVHDILWCKMVKEI